MTVCNLTMIGIEAVQDIVLEFGKVRTEDVLPLATLADELKATHGT